MLKVAFTLYDGNVKGEKIMNQVNIGKFIAECRKAKKLTQSELAEQLGVTDRAISNWENGKNMPDLSLFKPLCDILDITINDLMSGEKVKTQEYQEKLEENIVNTIDYTNKKQEKERNLLAIIFCFLGVFISFTAIAIFESESSWGSIYSIFGIFVSMIGVSILIGKLNFYKKILFNLGYLILSLTLLFIIDYIGVINIHQAPRFSLIKVSGENVMYYDTPFYDVVRCNVNKENEIFKVMKNRKYNQDNIDAFCK